MPSEKTQIKALARSLQHSANGQSEEVADLMNRAADRLFELSDGPSDRQWQQVLNERDNYHKWADILADAIQRHTGIDIGEHSNVNNPWAAASNAIENYGFDLARELDYWLPKTEPLQDQIDSVSKAHRQRWQEAIIKLALFEIRK